MPASAPLTVAQYQALAQLTDRLPGLGEASTDRRLGPLLGLAGEVGTLLAGYKKWIRDGSAYELFDENVREELGDIFWYLANAAAKWGFSLEEIAQENLDKTQDRWGSAASSRRKGRDPSDQFDAGFPKGQQMPRRFEVTIRPVPHHDGPEPKIEVIWRGKVVANALGDNTYEDSGYRFHDAFHLANAAVLGWSPVARGRIFSRKRTDHELLDAVEDGGRAIVIEEGVVAYMFAYARQHNYLVDVSSLDSQTLKAFRVFTHDLEVRSRPLWEVEEAIFKGFEVWRQLRRHNGGVIRGDLGRRELTFSPL